MDARKELNLNKTVVKLCGDTLSECCDICPDKRRCSVLELLGLIEGYTEILDDTIEKCDEIADGITFVHEYREAIDPIDPHEEEALNEILMACAEADAVVGAVVNQATENSSKITNETNGFLNDGGCGIMINYFRKQRAKKQMS